MIWWVYVFEFKRSPAELLLALQIVARRMGVAGGPGSVWDYANAGANLLVATPGLVVASRMFLMAYGVELRSESGEQEDVTASWDEMRVRHVVIEAPWVPVLFEVLACQNLPSYLNVRVKRSGKFGVYDSALRRLLPLRA